MTSWTRFSILHLYVSLFECCSCQSSVLQLHQLTSPSPPYELVSFNSSAGSNTENTLKNSQKITFHNLNKYKAICHCHVRELPISLSALTGSLILLPCLLCLTAAAGSSNGDCINPLQRALTFASVQLEVIVQEHTHTHTHRFTFSCVHIHTAGMSRRLRILEFGCQ